MQTVSRKLSATRSHHNPGAAALSHDTFTSPNVTIEIPKECLDGQLLQEIHFALWCAAQRARERGEPARRTRALEAASESLEGLEHIVNGNLALHAGEIVAREIPD
jgi:hypothetical protein